MIIKKNGKKTTPHFFQMQEYHNRVLLLRKNFTFSPTNDLSTNA